MGPPHPLVLEEKNENALGICELDLLQELFDGSGTLGPFPSPWDFGERLDFSSLTSPSSSSHQASGKESHLQHPSNATLSPTSCQRFFWFSSLFPLPNVKLPLVEPCGEAGEIWLWGDLLHLVSSPGKRGGDRASNLGEVESLGG